MTHCLPHLTRSFDRIENREGISQMELNKLVRSQVCIVSPRHPTPLAAPTRSSAPLRSDATAKLLSASILGQFPLVRIRSGISVDLVADRALASRRTRTHPSQRSATKAPSSAQRPQAPLAEPAPCPTNRLLPLATLS
eukprot:CAMPEP_0172171316 /NCGR_PEP_ID=MMETSP1050-20130122/11822_1 /TAXON_ID=233186 /ORGANISM="Cryptomonas curvata, Strain CCAP979/52" /LENGTH=137 /DNA_ID=CAMNT_0012842729 /DNA_START=372 /DNA_END=785 /DNA_ORIENTATION=-